MKRTPYWLHGVYSFVLLVLINVQAQAVKNCAYCWEVMIQTTDGWYCMNCNPEAFGAVAQNSTSSSFGEPSENSDGTQGDYTAGGIYNQNSGISSFNRMNFENLIELFDSDQQSYFAEQFSLGVSKAQIRQEMITLLEDSSSASSRRSDSSGSTESPLRLARSEDRFLDVSDPVYDQQLNNLIDQAMHEFSASRVDRAEVIRRSKEISRIWTAFCKKIETGKVSKKAAKRAAKKCPDKFIHVHSIGIGEGEDFDCTDVDEELRKIIANQYCPFIARDGQGRAVVFGLLVFDHKSQKVLLLWGNVSIELELNNVLPLLYRIIVGINLSPDISIQLKQLDFYVYKSADEGVTHFSE